MLARKQRLLTRPPDFEWFHTLRVADLFKAQQLSIPAIAGRLDISQVAAKSRLHRAKQTAGKLLNAM